MFLLRNIQERIGTAVAAGVAAVFFLICGAVLAFVVSPQQALEWRRISKLPELDATSYAATATGGEVVITGRLEGNEPLIENGMVAFYRERWDVEPADPDDEDDKPSGSWSTVEENAPALTIVVSGGSVTTLPAVSPTFGGNLHATLPPGTGGRRRSMRADSCRRGQSSQRVSKTATWSRWSATKVPQVTWPRTSCLAATVCS